MYRLFLSLFAISLASSVAHAGGNSKTSLPVLTCGSVAEIPVSDIPASATSLSYRFGGNFLHSVSAENTSSSPANPVVNFYGHVRVILVFEHPTMGQQSAPVGDAVIDSTIELELPGGYDGTPDLSGPSADRASRRNRFELAADLGGNVMDLLRVSENVHFSIQVGDCSSTSSNINSLVWSTNASASRTRFRTMID